MHKFKYKHPKSNKNSGSFSKELKEIDVVPKYLRVLESSGAQEYYSHFGITKILKFSAIEYEDYLALQTSQTFRCK